MAKSHPDEAAPQPKAWKLLDWLRQRGYELPGERENWHILKPNLEEYGSYRQTRRSQWDIERGIMAWYLAYDGFDDDAIHWSGTFGGEMAPATLINRLDDCILEETRGHDGGRSFFAGMKLTLSEEGLAKMKPKTRSVYIFKCDKCGYRTEDKRRDFDENYVHKQCGQDSRWIYVETVKEEVARTT